MYSLRRSLIPLLLAGILLTSCGGQVPAGEPTADIDATIQANAETMVASLLQTQTALAPTATNTSVPTPTVTAAPTTTALTLASPLASVTQGILLNTFVPSPTGTFYTSTPNPSSLAVGCNNLRLISSYTEPTGPFRPGQEFTQYWQVENNGTCNWVYLYHLVFVSGNRMGGSPGRLSKVIPPYKWTTLAVDLDAPNQTGTHTASWRFSDSGGSAFGATLPVSIKVENAPSTSTPGSPSYP
jgi:hypothetical protein